MTALVVVAGVAAPAAAADAQQAIAKIVDANRAGVAQYKAGQLAEARKTIKEALGLCKASGLDGHPVAARTHVHLGIILVDGFGLTDAGAREFREALAIEPTIELTPGLATPAAQTAFDEAVALAPPGRGAVAKGAPPSAVTAGDEARDDAAATMLARRAPAAHDGDDDDDDASADDGTSRLELRLLAGMGGGWASGAGDLNVDAHTSGASFSGSVLNHATAAVGYWVAPAWMLSLDGRFQRVTGPNVVDANGRTYHPASGAVAVLATATWSPPSAGVRPFVAASAGLGRIREVVTLSQLHDCGASHAETCVDTVGGGPVLAGAAAGFTYGLSRSFALVVGVGAQLAVPQSTFNVDLNAGLSFRL